MVGPAHSSSTEERIRDAARAEFARQGLGGARVARIAGEARANKERLYHYVGDKEALFAAVLEDALRRIVEAEPFGTDDLAAYVAAMLEFHGRDPTLVGLLLAEAREASGGPLLLEDERRAHYAQRAAAVREAQERGALRADVDPRIVVYALLALVVTAGALPQLTRLVLARDPPVGDEELRAGLRTLLDGLLVGR